MGRRGFKSAACAGHPAATLCPVRTRRAADELNLLPDGSAIAEMLSDYAVMREQARACADRKTR